MNPSEIQIWAGESAWSHYIFLWFFTLIFGTRMLLALWIGHWEAAVIFGAGIVLFAALAVSLRKSTRYRVTRGAVYRSEGIFEKSEQRFPIEELESVRIQQSPINRLFGIGTLVLKLKSGRYERIKGIKSPEIVGQKISALL